MDLSAAKDLILAKLERDLPPKRTYHSKAHTWDVYLTAIDIAAKEGVGGEDLVLLKTAALFHDIGFTEHGWVSKFLFTGYHEQAGQE